MIEAMEQEIINSINNRWTKDKMKRREIDIEKISECFRVICSSRNSTLNIIAKLKQLDELHQEVVDELKSNMKWIYNWITKDMIEDLINKYKSELKDKKREAECKAEIPEIIKFLDQLKIEIVQKTINKLLVFHKVKIGGIDMLEPKREWKTFESMEEELKKLREWKLISSKATEVKQLYYKGAYTDKPIECKVAGFVDDNEIILYVNSELHSIHPDYLLDMQRKDFSKDILIKEENMNASCPKEKVDKKEKFIIVDIETPFSFSPKDGIREVAAIVVEDYEVVEELHLAIINDEDEYKKGYGSGLENIEENEILKEEFKNLISKYKYPIVAHNASFERNFLRYWKWVDKDQIFYCSMNTMKVTVKLDSYKLVNLLKNYNIKSVQKHNAIQDVLDLLELLKRVKPKKWSKLNDSSNDSKVKRNYIVDKKKREEDKERLEKAKENIIENILNNKSIVFTGDTVISRVEISELAIQYGGSVKSSVSKKTDIVVVGENPGSKLTKAEELGIEILSEDKFLNLINKN